MTEPVGNPDRIADRDPVRLSAWFQGPTGSGQGGWTASRLASAMGQPATVAIRAPIPIETDMHIVAPVNQRATAGAAKPADEDDDAPWLLVNSQDGSTVLEGSRWDGVYPRTEPVSIDEAILARSRFPLPGDLHPVPVCFSCGLEPDSMRVHAGPLGDGRFATDWTVPAWAATQNTVDDGALWAAIDCAAAWYASCEGGVRRSVTAQLAVEILEPLQPGATYALVSWRGDWESGTWDGRKRGAASAAFDDAGTCVAVSTSFWIALE